jgi:MerR family transcriptional regulator, light-induced transcriptional regulator
MSIDDNRPVFNLKAVVQETGLRADTLRAWERRYGLPQPGRTDGGHRLYTAREIEMLKWLAFRQQEGMSISRAVDLWRRLEVEGHDPLVARPYGPAATPPATTTRVFTDDNALSDLRAAWLDACLSFDEVEAEQILIHAFALYPPEVVCVELLQKSLIVVGDGWYQGKISVQQEHFASALARRRLQAILAASPAATRAGRILAICAPGEQHTFGLLSATLLLRRQGWNVLYLGADVPLEKLETTVAAVQSNLILASAHQLQTAVTLLEMAQILNSVEVTVTYGGAIFDRLPLLRRRIPAHFLGSQLAQAPALVERLISARPAVPKVEPSPTGYKETHRRFQQQRRQLESDLRANVKQLPQDYLQLALASMATSIDAALRLGNIEWATPEFEWLRGMLSYRNVSEGSLQAFLHAYRQGVRTHLGNGAQPISHWLDGLPVGAAKGGQET